MSEEIRCRRCKKQKKAEENWNGLKTCPVCHEKDLGDSRVRSEERKQNRPSEELVENLKFSEPLPQFLRNFSEFQKYWRMHNLEVKFEDYIKELNTHKMREVQKQMDTQVSKTKGQFQAKKQILMKFLRFDIWQPSNRQDCTRFRLQKLGLWREEPIWLKEHTELCEECRLWLENLLSDVLDSEDGLFVHLAYAKDFKDREDFERVIARCPHHSVKAEVVTIDDQLKKITVLCDPKNFDPKLDFDEWLKAKHPNMVDVCSSCGTVLKDGRCSSCSPSSHQSNDQSQIEEDDWYQRHLEEQNKQQQQEQRRQEGFMDRLRRGRDQIE